MNWESWVLVAFFGVGMLVRVIVAGEPRAAYWPSGGPLVVALAFDAAILWVVLRLADVL
jgi:hypothetical protein